MDDIREWNKDKSDDVIVDITEIGSEIDSEADISEASHDRIKPKDAVELINKIIQWAEDEIVGPNDISVLRRLREKAVLKVLETRAQQKNITDYFS